MTDQSYTIGDITYIGHELLCYSDYSNGGSLARSNVRVIRREAESAGELSYGKLSDIGTDYCEDVTKAVFAAKPDIIVLHGGYGTIAVLMRSDWEHTEDTLRTLSDYPVLDDDDLNDVETEMEREAWDDWIESDLKTAVLKLVDNDAFDDWLTYDADSDMIRVIYIESCESCSEYGHVDGDAWWIDVDKIAASVLESLMIKWKAI